MQTDQKSRRLLWWCLAGAAVLIAMDQAVKSWALRTLRVNGDIRLIPDVLHLMYRENYGAAFSILQNQTVLLVSVTGVVLLALLVLLVTGRVRPPLLIAAFSLVIAGGIGNLIDRVSRGFVVDYIYFVPIDFPVFNLADCCVVIGTALIVLYVLVIEPRAQKEQAGG